MAWWERWLGRGEAKQIDNSLDLLRELYGTTESSSGVRVTARTALEATTAFACARVIADGLSQVPFRVMRAQGERREPARSHPLSPLLEWAPNEYQTSTELMDMLAMHLVFVGNAYVLLMRDSRGRLIELLPLDPGWVTVELDTRAWQTAYKVQLPDGPQVAVERGAMWHLRGPTWNGWMGLEGVKLAREAIGLSLSAEASAGSTMRNGSRLSGILTTDQNLSAEQRASLKAAWQQSMSGAANAGKIGVLSNGMRFTPMSMTATDAQFIEQRKFQVEEICRVFRVMPLMVGYSDKAATYASAEQMFLAHVVHTMTPWYSRIEASANVALLTPAEREQGHYTKFFTQALLRGSVKDRAEFYRTLYGIGAIAPNEIRSLEDMNPYDGGDRHAVPLNMISPALADAVQGGAQPAAGDDTTEPL